MHAGYKQQYLLILSSTLQTPTVYSAVRLISKWVKPQSVSTSTMVNNVKYLNMIIPGLLESRPRYQSPEQDHILLLCYTLIIFQSLILSMHVLIHGYLKQVIKSQHFSFLIRWRMKCTISTYPTWLKCRLHFGTSYQRALIPISSFMLFFPWPFLYSFELYLRTNNAF